MFTRSSGVLLHITSLPSPHGIGSLGRAAYAFVDFLATARQTYWQVLPLGHTGFGASPYQCFSTAAGNPFLIDLDLLAADGLLTEEELQQADAMLPDTPERVDFEALGGTRLPLLRQAFSRIGDTMRKKMSAFAAHNTEWLPDYALFMALKAHFGGKPLWEWADVDAIRRDRAALDGYRSSLAEEIDFYVFLQTVFFEQWSALRQYANTRGIRMIGDLPIYVSADSCDVWSHPQLFQISPNRAPRRVSGVPPDYFSSTGQRWGNPVYAWETHETKGYAWWIWRLRANLALFDVLRIDHFRGLESYWSVPADAPDAVAGRWEPGPGHKLLRALRAHLGDAPLIAEDLGVQTDAVRTLLRDSGFPGMRVLIFGFSLDEDSEHLPHNYPVNCVAYSSTHDSQTARQQIDDFCTPAERAFARDYLPGSDTEPDGLRFVRGVFASPARIAMASMQDLLSLGAAARMNLPATVGGNNWRWRMRADALTPALRDTLRHLTELYKRAAPAQLVPPVTHVVFDLDGTLLHTLPDLADAVNAALVMRNYPERTLEEIRRFVGNGVRRLIRLALPSEAPESEVDDCLADFRSYYNDHLTHGTAPYDGIPDLLTMLQLHGISCGVISNKYHAAAERLIRHYFGDAIAVTFGERPGVPRKPDPTAVRELLAALHADPLHTLYVGDSAVDMRTARRAGLFSVGVTWGYGDREALEQNGASRLVDTPAELLALLEEAGSKKNSKTS